MCISISRCQATTEVWFRQTAQTATQSIKSGQYADSLLKCFRVSTWNHAIYTPYIVNYIICFAILVTLVLVVCYFGISLISYSLVTNRMSVSDIYGCPEN